MLSFVRLLKFEIFPDPFNHSSQKQMDAFEARRKQALSALISPDEDKSPKGSLDAPIVALCGYINSLPNVFTTSSCSGLRLYFVRLSHNSLNSHLSVCSCVLYLKCTHNQTRKQQ